MTRHLWREHVIFNISKDFIHEDINDHSCKNMPFDTFTLNILEDFKVGRV